MYGQYIRKIKELPVKKREQVAKEFVRLEITTQAQLDNLPRKATNIAGVNTYRLIEWIYQQMVLEAAVNSQEEEEE